MDPGLRRDDEEGRATASGVTPLDVAADKAELDATVQRDRRR
jgi:hypothetical protein